MNFAINISNLDMETTLIAACLREERAAQKKLYESFYGKLMAVGMRYANNPEDARDILNEGFVKIFKHLDRYQVGTSLESWMKRIIVNTAIDFYRKSIRHRSEELDTARHISSHDEDALSKCSVEEIMSAIKTLPISYRTVFNLYAVEGYSHKEVADALGITESTSRSNLVKARIKLQEILLASAKYTSYGK